MQGFKSFIEALKFDDPRTSLQNHPLVNNSTFGIEIEFAVVSPPFKEMKDTEIYYALHHNKEFVELVAIEYDVKEPSEQQMIDYINANKKACFDLIYYELAEQGNFLAGRPSSEYQHQMLYHYFKHVSQIVKKYNFNIQMGQEASKNMWAMGTDGYETTYNIPLLEIRSSILTQKDIPNLTKVLIELSNFIKSYKKEIIITGNTGLHIHVGNPKTKDMFTRLAVASQSDEDAIENIENSNNRDFDSAAKLKDDAHRIIADKLFPLTQFQNPYIMTTDQFNKWVYKNIERNTGINTISEHPTVEYRYLSTGTLVNNPQKIIDFIKYFIDHTAQMSNKNQITFESPRKLIKVKLTKLPNQVRIDSYKYNNPPKVSRPNVPMKDVDNPPERTEPIKQWWNNIGTEKRDELRDKINKNLPNSWGNRKNKELLKDLGLDS